MQIMKDGPLAGGGWGSIRGRKEKNPVVVLVMMPTASVMEERKSSYIPVVFRAAQLVGSTQQQRIRGLVMPGFHGGRL